MVKSVENKPVEVSKSQIAATAKKAMLRIVFWVLFLGILYGLWLNPQIITNMVKFISMQTATEESQEENTVREDEFYRRMNVLQNQINQLQNQISSLPEGSSATVDLSRFDSKLEAIEKQNLNVIDSKADVATVLGIITRLDKIEERLDTLAKISDDGALVLTATMMVKESSENGTNFAYEAEILQQLAKNDTAIQGDVETISRYAREGVKSQNSLINEFKKIYRRLAKVQTKQDLEGKNWKEVLNIKFNEVVKVKRVNDVLSPQNEAENENNFKETVSSLFKGMDSFVSAKTVVGDAIHVGDTIILPLVDVSFGVGAGAFAGEKKNNGGGGLAGKMTPCAVLVIQNGTIKLVNVKNQDGLTKVLDMVPDFVNKFTDGKFFSSKEDDEIISEAKEEKE